MNMDKDFAKRLKNFDRVWARVQGAKEGEKPKARTPSGKPGQNKGKRGKGRRF